MKLHVLNIHNQSIQTILYNLSYKPTLKPNNGNLNYYTRSRNSKQKTTLSMINMTNNNRNTKF